MKPQAAKLAAVGCSRLSILLGCTRYALSGVAGTRQGGAQNRQKEARLDLPLVKLPSCAIDGEQGARGADFVVTGQSLGKGR